MVAVHQHERVEYFCQHLSISPTNLCSLRRPKNVVSDRTPTLMLREENVRQAGGWPSRSFDRRENERLFQLLLVIFLPKGPEQFRCFLQRLGCNCRRVANELRCRCT